MTDAPRSVNDCYVGHPIDDRHFDLLGVSTELYKAFEKVEESRVGESK